VDPAMAGATPMPTAARVPDVNVERAFAMQAPPGNLTFTPDGRRILSLHQWFTPPRVMAEVRGDGDAAQVMNYPAPGEGVMPSMGAVLGVRSDTAGQLYILDNGNVGKAPPKIVVWDSRSNRLVRTIPLRNVTDTNSFVNDVVFDYQRNHLYLSDPAGGPNAALLVVDLGTGRARRVLQGHQSVIPERIDFEVEGMKLRRKLRDGTLMTPFTGVDGIGIDYAREWVYFAPLHGASMYRIRAADLANASMTGEQLGARVERYSSKPHSDGIALDQAGNIYLGDLAGNAIGVITPDRQYRVLAQGAEYKWVDDFEFAPDGMLYVVTTQLHRSPELNAGNRAAELPFRVFRLRPLAPGRQGF
jgi:sugar lactone lactonase YvrE